MTERPILFQGAMVRAILADSKTQTRRLLNPQPATPAMSRSMPRFTPKAGVDINMTDHSDLALPFCPYGKPGDRLWVRETFMDNQRGAHVRRSYRADFTAGDHPLGLKWTPSIFMKRKASRITLEIIKVRVERLQAISESDAIAEGTGTVYAKGIVRYVPLFADLWDSINGKRAPWMLNPWVWVVEFRRAS